MFSITSLRSGFQRCLAKRLRPLRTACLVLLSFLSFNELYAQTAVTHAMLQTDARMVLVPVTVIDHHGKTISGLQAKDFTVLDEKTPQRIISFASQDAPCSVGLVLDISGSMRNVLGTAEGVARAFLETANTKDEFILLTVSTRPAATFAFTTDTEALEQSIGANKSGGMTALIDTIYLGLHRMRETSHARKALLILSDGMDNDSRYSESELIRAALESDVQIYTIIISSGSVNASNSRIPFRPNLVLKPIDQVENRRGPFLLEQLAEKTGGLHFRVRNDAEAKQAAVKSGQALRNEYVIGYRPPDSAQVGKWRRVSVKSDLRNVNLYLRSGYYFR